MRIGTGWEVVKPFEPWAGLISLVTLILRGSYKLNHLFPIWGAQTLRVLEKGDGGGSEG